MFTKVLVANRGEIAVRIMRTCRELGIATVAVHPPADAGARHVREADESVLLPDGPASANYLSVDAIVAAASSTGARAIHPGYGFLAENEAFARAAADAGIVFIGPSPEAISTMGGKVSAREVAIRAQVPLAPGSNGVVPDADAVRAFGAEHGYPVLIKAAFGGGGRGMRQVASPDDVDDAFDAAVREASSSFVDGTVYCERYLVNARHVEVQVLADMHGSTVYLADRDCSVQRRHQKLIEEAPAPGLSDELRRRMGDAAVRLAQEVGYSGAGTVEFLVEGEEFYFLEMNTRVQVEHPVTEAVTGRDIVADQIRVAAGDPLGFSQGDVTVRGAAIEARINAENPSSGLFLPSPGKVDSLVEPRGDGLRWDAGYESGDEVLPLYDSLVGKLIAWAPTRDEAIDRLRAALGELVVEGIDTTAPAASFIVGTDDFRAMSISTRWLEQEVEFPDFDQEAPRNEVVVGGRWYLVPRFADGSGARTAAAPVAIEPAAPSGRPKRVGVERDRAVAFDGKVKAPLQGTVIKANVAVGDEVTRGDVLFVLEAMKMENPVIAPVAGTIVSVSGAVGESASAGTVLAELEAAA